MWSKSAHAIKISHTPLTHTDTDTHLEVEGACLHEQLVTGVKSAHLVGRVVHHRRAKPPIVAGLDKSLGFSCAQAHPTRWPRGRGNDSGGGCRRIHLHCVAVAAVLIAVCMCQWFSHS